MRLAQHRHALALEAELPAVLRAFGHLDAGLRAVERRHLERAAERRRGHRDRHLAVEVGAVALEELVRLDRQEDVEIAGRAAAQAGLALVGEADAGAVLDAGRDVDRQRLLLGDAALAGAFRAWILDGLAAAMALRAGALDREEALRGAHLAVAAAHRAGDRLGAGLGAGAGAFVAGDRSRHADLRGLAGIGLLQRDLHVVAQIGAALAPAGRAALAAAHHVAENVLEDVGEAAGREAGRAVAHAAVLEGGMAEPVIGGALLRVLQRLVGFVDFLELVLAGVIARIAVGMELHGELAESRS